MKTIIGVCFVALIVLSSCCAHCPRGDVVFLVNTGTSVGIVGVEKGFFDIENEGKEWMLLEDYKKRVSDMDKQLTSK